uniref:Reverse transcriptase n=1 Tax=Heligmosomoides polygyrus TaxID=6339 RepID=A0A8L8K6L8_HELPZ
LRTIGQLKGARTFSAPAPAGPTVYRTIRKGGSAKAFRTGSFVFISVRLDRHRLGSSGPSVVLNPPTFGIAAGGLRTLLRKEGPQQQTALAGNHRTAIGIPAVAWHRSFGRMYDVPQYFKHDVRRQCSVMPGILRECPVHNAYKIEPINQAGATACRNFIVDGLVVVMTYLAEMFLYLSENANDALVLSNVAEPRRAVRATDKPTESAEPQRESRIFTASLSKWRCGVTKVDGPHEDLVGAQTTALVQLLGVTRTARLDTGSQVSIIPLQMLGNALQDGYDLNADVEEIDLDRSKAVYDASGNPMSFKGAVRLAMQVNKGTRHRIDLFVQAGGDDLIVLGPNALEKLGWNLPHNVQSSRGRTEWSSGRRPKHRETNAKEAAVRRHRSKASKTVTRAEQLCLKPEETKDISLCCDDIKQDGVLRSSGEILPDTEESFEKGSLRYSGSLRGKQKKAPAVTCVPQPRVAHMQRKRVIKKEPVGRSTLAKENAQLSLSKVDGNEVDYVKTAMGEVRAELTRHLSALERRLQAMVWATPLTWPIIPDPGKPGVTDSLVQTLSYLGDDATVRGRDAKCLRNATVQAITDVWNDNHSTTAWLTQKINEAIIEHFSKYVIAAPLPDYIAITVAQTLMSECILKFRGQVMTEIGRILLINDYFATPIITKEMCHQAFDDTGAYVENLVSGLHAAWRSAACFNDRQRSKYKRSYDQTHLRVLPIKVEDRTESTCKAIRLKSHPVPLGTLAGCPEFFARSTEPDYLPVCTPVKNSSTKGPHSPDPERAAISAAMGTTSTERLLISQGLTRLCKLRTTRMTICTCNVRTLGCLRLKRFSSVPALTVFVGYSPSSDYHDENVEAFYVGLEKSYKEDRTLYKVIVGDFKIGPRRSAEALHIETRDAHEVLSVKFFNEIFNRKFSLNFR